MTSTEWSVPTAIAQLKRLQVRLEDIRKDLATFTSEEDECGTYQQPESLMGELTFTVRQMQDSVSSIRYRIDNLIEEEPK